MACTSATGDDRSGRLPDGDADLVFELHDLAPFVELSRALTSLLERTALTALQTRDFRQAVLEMVANALEWGRGKGQGPWALVTCRVGPQDVTVIVRDRGPGFDHSQANRIQSRDEVGHGHSPFGIMLAKGLSDVLSYNDRGNEVTLVKRFGPNPGPPVRR